ncbi:36886_t:CDS:1, partial [Racocetra persica]
HGEHNDDFGNEINLCIAVEKSFSVYNNLLEDDRQNLSENSLKILNM